VLLLSLRGTTFLYYGDEIGMPEAPVPRELLRDPVGLARWPDDEGRDRFRTPMQWTDGPGAGFTAAGVEPWLPVGDAASCNVGSQERDPDSTLHLVRVLIGLRSSASLGLGAYRTVYRDRSLWAWSSGGLTIAANLSEERAAVDLPRGRVLLTSSRGRDRGGPARVDSLEPWEAVVIAPE
jgi:alpha-glucosidase